VTRKPTPDELIYCQVPRPRESPRRLRLIPPISQRRLVYRPGVIGRPVPTEPYKKPTFDNSGLLLESHDKRGGTGHLQGTSRSLRSQGGRVLSDNIASGVLEPRKISRGRCRGRSEDDLENRASLYSLQFLSSGLGQPSRSRYSDFSGTPMSLNRSASYHKNTKQLASPTSLHGGVTGQIPQKLISELRFAFSHCLWSFAQSCTFIMMV